MPTQREKQTNSDHQDYHLITVNDKENTKEVYDSLSHSKFYQVRKENKDESGKKLRTLINNELNAKNSRFYKNYKKMGLNPDALKLEQTGSTITQVLTDIATSSKQTSKSIFDNAVSEEDLEKKFPDFITTEDPLTDENKLRIHEAIQADGSVKRGLSFWRKFLLGRKVNVGFRVKKADLLKEEVADNIANRIDIHPDILEYKSRLRDIDDEAHLRENVQAICDNLFGYGRAALVMVFNDDKIPVRLIPLSSHSLGTVYMDKNTFEFLAVEYKEIEGDNNILLASDILYFTLNDNNVTPASRYYGTSQVFPLLSIAETNMINRERNYPEIIRKRWAATLLIKTSTRSAARNQSIVDMVADRAGLPVVIPDLVDAKNIQVDTELDSLVNYSNEADKKMLRDLELPMVAGGFSSSETTRAMAQAELNVWSESTLEDLRELVSETLVKEWYYPNIIKIIEMDVIENGTETNFVPPAVFDPTVEEEQDPDNPRPTSSVEAQQDITGDQPDQPTKKAPPPNPDLDKRKSAEPPADGGDDTNNIINKLGFDINALDKLKLERPDPETLKQMVFEKIVNIAVDITQGLVPLKKNDVLSLTGEIKLPFETFLEFENIIFDNFLDRAAGVLGILTSGVIDDDIALELMKLDEFIPKMRQVRVEREKKQAAIFGTPEEQAEAAKEKDEEEEEEKEGGDPMTAVKNRDVSNPTDPTTSAARKIKGRISQRTNRGSVS